MQSLESLNLPKPNRPDGETTPAAPIWMKITVAIMRLVVGGAFILSGWSKGVDVWGSVIKIEEYLQVWGWNIPTTVVTVGAYLLAGAEFVLGVLVLTGCYRRVAVWLTTAIMAFFLPLTLYILIEDPVSDCGCFGDLLILSNLNTFLKNVLLTTMLILLILWNRRVGSLFDKYTQWIVGAMMTVYISIVAGIGLYSQPLVDFRRFGVDTCITADNLSGDDSDAQYTFIYSKDGVEKQFDVDNLPDSTWSYVDRKLISGSETAIDAFNLYDGDDDVASQLLDDSQVLLITVPVATDAIGSATIIDDIAGKAEKCGISTVLALGDNSEAVDRYIQDIDPTYAVVSTESKQLKELARGKVALTLIDNCVIRWKRTLLSVPRSFIYDSSECDWDTLAPWGNLFMISLTLVFAGALFILFLADRGIIHLSRLKRKNLSR